MAEYNMQIPRRPQVPTDDHGQPLAPPRYRPSAGDLGRPGGSGGWSALAAIVLFAAVVLGIIDSIAEGELNMAPWIIGLLVLFVLIVLFQNIIIVQQETAYVIERLGKFHKVWTAGLHVKVPFIDRVSNRVSLKEQVLDFQPQSVITKDNVSMKIDTVVYLCIRDPKLVTYGVQHAIPAIENLTATTLRNLIGELTLDQTLTSRDTVNAKMQSILDEVTDPWGIKVNRVELKNILPPKDIQEAMEKEMRAEREKREAILRAEGSKQARILEAEGIKDATILEAQAAKEKMILEAQAEKEAAIARAEGQSEAIRRIKEAEAQGIRLVKEAGADTAVVQLRSLDTLVKVADGKATQLVIPADLSGLAGGLAALKEGLEDK